MKLRLLAATLAAVVFSGNLFAQTAPAAASSAAPASSDRATLSYALGYQTGRDLAETKADLDINGLIRALQDGFARRAPTMPGDKLAEALKQFQRKMAEQERADFERAAKENKSKSDVFLASNRSKTGVVTLPSGLQYRVIEAGNGLKPTTVSTVTVHLRGSVSSGQEFANTYSTQNAQPASFKVSDFPLAGVREALQMMPTGSRWEVFMSPDQAYGKEARPIGPGQAVIFDIKLISIK